MSEQYVEYTDLIQAGCSEDTAKKCLECFSRKQFAGAIKCLEESRCDLLEELHCCEKKIECMDYLIYQVKNRKDH